MAKRSTPCSVTARWRRVELSRFGGQVTFEVRNSVAERTVLLTEPAGQASAGQ